MARKPKEAPPVLTPAEEKVAILDDLARLTARQKLYINYKNLYDPEHPEQIGVYKWQEEFHNAGATYSTRVLLAANRIGKSRTSAAECAMHLIGKYPPWWQGRRFNKPIKLWCGSTTNEKSRDVVQEALLGPIGEWGTGWVPAEKLLGKPKTRQAGIPDVVDSFHVLHASGGYSKCILKCHPAGQRVLMSDGRWVGIENVKLGDFIRCADGVDRPVFQQHSYLNAEIMEIVTRVGSIKGTPNHPVFVKRGKFRMDELVVGDELEIADADVGSSYEEDWKVVWTALLIGDGCLRAKTPEFCCADPSLLEQAKAYLPEDLYVVRKGSLSTIDWKISSRLHKRNRLKESLERDGLWGKKSGDKFIPEWVFRLCRQQRIMFLRWLWSTDGTVYPRTARYDTTSRRLADDVRALLWSVGIHAPVKERPPVRDIHNNRHWVELSGSERIAFQEIGKINRDNEARFSRGPQPKGPRGEILEIKKLPNGPVYGVGIPDVFELVVEGFRVGNTYEQGREAWQGSAVDVVWMDEEAPKEVWSEAVTRTVDTNGMMMLTFTPLLGETEVVYSLLHADAAANIYVKNVTWDDAPHLDEKKKAELKATYTEQEIEARTKGHPYMGRGRIFPIAEKDILIDPIQIPNWWVRINGIDFGMDHPTAGAFCAIDRDTDTFYVYDCYKSSGQTPTYHAKAMKRHGEWIPTAWPRDGLQRDKGSGIAIRDQYIDNDLFMLKENAHYQDERGEHVEPGLMEMLDYMKSGRFKVFRGICEPFLEELRMYHRDEKGLIVKIRDDIISATRYAFVMRRYASLPVSKVAIFRPPAVPILGRR